MTLLPQKDPLTGKPRPLLDKKQLSLEDAREFAEFIKESRIDYLDLGHWLIKVKNQNLNDWMNP